MDRVTGDVVGVRSAGRWLLDATGIALPWIVGLLYALSGLDELADGRSVAQAAVVALGAVHAVALTQRHRRPELVMAVVLAVDLAYHLLVPEVVVPFAGMVAIWALGTARPPRVSCVGLVGLVAVSAVNFFTTTAADALFVMAVSVSVWALAESTRNRRIAIEDGARRAASDERARIARELHDVIAHSVSVIVVQASAADDVFDTRPDQARAALRAIEQTGRDALGDLRHLLSTFRPAPDGAPVAPQPGLAQLDALTEQMGAAGLEVVVNRTGEPAALPTGVDLSAYRIVQEALTNTLRHARATLAEVTFSYLPDAVEIEVVDDGRAGPAKTADGAGYGVLGMRERAVLLGGSLEAGPTAHGGFRVHARLPLAVVR